MKLGLTAFFFNLFSLSEKQSKQCERKTENSANSTAKSNPSYIDSQSRVLSIPLGVTFSNAVSKLKAQSSKVSFH